VGERVEKWENYEKVLYCRYCTVSSPSSLQLQRHFLRSLNSNLTQRVTRSFSQFYTILKFNQHYDGKELASTACSTHVSLSHFVALLKHITAFAYHWKPTDGQIKHETVADWMNWKCYDCDTTDSLLGSIHIPPLVVTWTRTTDRVSQNVCLIGSVPAR